MLFDLLIDVLLVTGFGVQHSVLATLKVKRLAQRLSGVDGLSWRTVTSFCNIAYILGAAPLWRGIPIDVWQMQGTAFVVVALIGGLSWLWYFQIHLWEYDLGLAFGSTPFFYWLNGVPGPAVQQWRVGMRRWIVFPVHTAFFPMFFAQPTMTVSGLVLAVTANLYNVIGTYLYDWRLHALAGKPYQEYRAKTGLFLPRLTALEGAVKMPLPEPTHLRSLRHYAPSVLLGVILGVVWALVFGSLPQDLASLLSAWCFVAVMSVLCGVVMRILLAERIESAAPWDHELQSFMSASAGFTSATSLVSWSLLHYLGTGAVLNLVPILPMWVTILWLSHFTAAQLNVVLGESEQSAFWRTISLFMPNGANVLQRAFSSGPVVLVDAPVPFRQAHQVLPAPRPHGSQAGNSEASGEVPDGPGQLHPSKPGYRPVRGPRSQTHVPSRYQPVAHNLTELAALADQLRALQVADGSYSSPALAAPLQAQTAGQLRLISRHASPLGRAVLELYADAHEGNQASFRRAANLRATLLCDGSEDELALFCGPLKTWHGKAKTKFHSVVAAFAQTRWNQFIEPMAESIGEVRQHLGQRLQAPELTVAGVPAFRVHTRFACGGEAAIPPVHFAYFLPTDEGVAPRGAEATIVFQDAYQDRYRQRSRVLGANVLAPALNTSRSSQLDLELLLLWFRGHDLGHYFRLPQTDFKALRSEIPGGHQTSMVLQEVMADVLGFLMVVDGPVQQHYHVPRGAVAEVFLAELLQYLHRGPQSFIDSGAAFIEFSFLLENGFITLDRERQQLHWAPERLAAGIQALAKTLTASMLGGDWTRLRSLIRDHLYDDDARTSVQFVRQLQQSFDLSV